MTGADSTARCGESGRQATGRNHRGCIASAHSSAGRSAGLQHPAYPRVAPQSASLVHRSPVGPTAALHRHRLSPSGTQPAAVTVTSQAMTGATSTPEVDSRVGIRVNGRNRRGYIASAQTSAGRTASRTAASRTVESRIPLSSSSASIIGSPASCCLRVSTPLPPPQSTRVAASIGHRQPQATTGTTSPARGRWPVIQPGSRPQPARLHSHRPLFSRMASCRGDSEVRYSSGQGVR